MRPDLFSWKSCERCFVAWRFQPISRAVWHLAHGPAEEGGQEVVLREHPGPLPELDPTWLPFRVEGLQVEAEVRPQAMQDATLGVQEGGDVGVHLAPFISGSFFILHITYILYVQHII